MADRETDAEPGVGADSFNDTKREELIALGQEMLALAEQVPLDPSRLRTLGNRALDLAGRIQYTKPLTGSAAIASQRAAAAKAKSTTSPPAAAGTANDEPPVAVVAPPKPRPTVEESIIEGAGLRTPAEIADWLSSLRPGKPVTSAQVEAAVNDDPAIHASGGKYSHYAANRIRRALGIQED